MNIFWRLPKGRNNENKKQGENQSRYCLHEEYFADIIYSNKTKYFRLRLDEVSSGRPKRNLRETWDWPGTDLVQTWDRPETDLRLNQTALRWRLRPLDNFVPNGQTDTQTKWLTGLLDGAKNNCQGWESVGLAGVRRDAAPVVSREPGHVSVAVTGPGRTWRVWQFIPMW